MTNQNLIAIRGDDVTCVLTFKDSLGVVIPITGWVVFFTIKTDPLDDDAHAILKKDITTHYDPTHGVSKITLTNIETGALDIINYYYDVQVKNTLGIVTTVMKGNFTIVEDITRRTTPTA